MWLTKKEIISIVVLIMLVLWGSLEAFCAQNKTLIENKGGYMTYDLLYSAKSFYNAHKYDIAIKKYQEVLDRKSTDSIHVFRELALSYAKTDHPELASQYIEKYIKASLNITFVGHSYFDQIGSSESYQSLVNKYLKKFDGWSVFCFYVGFIGLFITVVLNLRKRSDKIANLLMSIFVLQHSFFIIHICFLLTNYQYYLPHTLYMSTVFSFTYGPLIYFYFKRVTSKYKFRLVDLWHLLPTFLLVVFLLYPVYVLTAEEKLKMMLNGTTPHGSLITISKLISLLIYGVLVINMYRDSVKNNSAISAAWYKWQRNIVIFCSVYIVTYSIYAVLIVSHIYSGFLFHIQVAAMAVLVLYVSYTAFVSPSIFGNWKVIKTESLKQPAKYQKSGLTESLSLEFRDKLLFLLNTQKIYRQNDITLQKLSILLDTTRHNTSQIINEHFELNFFELINMYRIEEAKELLKGEKPKNFNIIDVAYEVGFNNKVTFNKSFKKYNNVTPTQYIKLHCA